MATRLVSLGKRCRSPPCHASSVRDGCVVCGMGGEENGINNTSDNHVFNSQHFGSAGTRLVGDTHTCMQYIRSPPRTPTTTT